ncbi:Splicing factor 3B subunit 4 [Vitis vinifera]|uniref:Splicing factor 3B subunit 4 n=1 Tax=Vitis vinifera TaxID=29760 RepID=A0A438CTT3_VITVI|nr:Splicing factor 3B subunit 4 [Vitis vinifera]
MTTRIAPGVGANLLGQHSAERNQDATAYVGNLDPQVTEELLWELFVQAGPVVNVYVPKDRVTNLHQGYGFVEFRSEEDADYASQDKKSLDVGANLFVGNLDPDVDEKLLYDTFSAFGVIVTNPKVMPLLIFPFLRIYTHIFSVSACNLLPCDSIKVTCDAGPMAILVTCDAGPMAILGELGDHSLRAVTKLGILDRGNGHFQSNVFGLMIYESRCWTY